MRFVLLMAALAAAPAVAQIKIDNAWTRATAPDAKIAVGYMVIQNGAAVADRLIGASSPAAERVEPHITVRDGEVMRMREVKGYDIPARGSFELKPGGAHLMLVNIKAPFKEGAKVPLTLRFERSGEVKTELNVGRLTDVTKHAH